MIKIRKDNVTNAISCAKIVPYKEQFNSIIIPANETLATKIPQNIRINRVCKCSIGSGRK